jgi:hypothetical protein
MNRKNRPPLNVRPHHIVISVVAIIVAVALVLNYYLW